MVKIIAEIGINHNGSVEICKKMMLLAKFAGVDYVKIQKRTPDLCVPEDQKLKLKDTPWGQMTYLEYKERIEFNESQIEELTKITRESPSPNNYEKIISIIDKSFEVNDVELMNEINVIINNFNNVPFYKTFNLLNEKLKILF